MVNAISLLVSLFIPSRVPIAQSKHLSHTKSLAPPKMDIPPVVESDATKMEIQQQIFDQPR